MKYQWKNKELSEDLETFLALPMVSLGLDKEGEKYFIEVEDKKYPYESREERDKDFARLVKEILHKNKEDDKDTPEVGKEKLIASL